MGRSDNAARESVVIHPVIGKLTPQTEWYANGSKFMSFESDSGVSGLAYVDGSDLHLLAVCSVHEGIGLFRRFIGRCKQHYQSIRCWTITEPRMRYILPRYGFSQGHDIDSFGEMQEVWDWNAGHD